MRPTCPVHGAKPVNVVAGRFPGRLLWCESCQVFWLEERPGFTRQVGMKRDPSVYEEEFLNHLRSADMDSGATCRSKCPIHGGPGTGWWCNKPVAGYRPNRLYYCRIANAYFLELGELNDVRIIGAAR